MNPRLEASSVPWEIPSSTEQRALVFNCQRRNQNEASEEGGQRNLGCLCSTLTFRDLFGTLQGAHSLLTDMDMLYVSPHWPGWSPIIEREDKRRSKKMRRPDEKGVREERSGREPSHNHQHLDPGCCMHSKASCWASLPFWTAYGCPPQSVSLLEWRFWCLLWPVKTQLLKGQHSQGFHSLPKWQRSQKMRPFNTKAMGRTRKWWVQSRLATFQGLRVIKSLGKSGWT